MAGWIKYLLTTEQKKSDFKPETDEGPLQMFSTVSKLLVCILYTWAVWRGGEMVMTSDCCGFDSHPFHFHVTTLGKLFTHTHVPLSPSSIICYWSKGGDAMWLGR